MQKINLKDIKEEERRSPRGKFHKRVKDISIALGRDPASLDLRKRHPFDLALVRVPPGKAYCPYHVESAQWEMYLVVSGRGAVRDNSGTSEVVAGDAFLFKPGEAHQLLCAGDEDFVYYVIADNPLNDSCYYPDSGKWMALKEGSEMVMLKGEETDYFAGEE
jgi:uncharacterized cupin superfamily protein